MYLAFSCIDQDKWLILKQNSNQNPQQNPIRFNLNIFKAARKLKKKRQQKFFLKRIKKFNSAQNFN